ncbi:pentatricopeptide repeat-containing protein At3g22690-like [Punica granatum]|uniref:Pentatricopeptide repeat-containing protein At3g22690-like n=1 Tax=Punica granatum TaxID=22663 RepID=A0A6P8BPL6_PUNGR|nr:pentatricopeptide repeat-containing protein At3g22690-like [Punica granatum]
MAAAPLYSLTIPYTTLSLQNPSEEPNNNASSTCRGVTRLPKHPETAIWNRSLRTHLEAGSSSQVLQCYCEIVACGVPLDISTFHFLIHACSRSLLLRLGREVHGRALKHGLGGNQSLRNCLMGLYAKAGMVWDVELLFQKVPGRDVVTWNTMISCHVRAGMLREAMRLFGRMRSEGVEPNEVTMVSLLSAVAKLRDLQMGEELHRFILEKRLDISGSLLNCLVDMYIKCGAMDRAQELLPDSQSRDDVILWTSLIGGHVKSGNMNGAQELFDRMPEKNLISWTTMASGYVQLGDYRNSLEVFREMLLGDVAPDEVALVTALNACSHVVECGRPFVLLGGSIHGLLVKLGMALEGFLGNALLDFYVKSGWMEDARSVFRLLPRKTAVSWNSMLEGFCRTGEFKEAKEFFDGIPEKDTVSWNIMIGCCTRFGYCKESFELFHQMQNSKVEPDKVTLVCLLSACAKVGALSHGIWIHVHMKKNGIELDNALATGLVDMYGKCGSAEKAEEVFSEIPNKSVRLWTAMMAGYAMEGKALKAVELFSEMVSQGLKPDFITFVALLSACSHGGLLEEAYRYFNEMESKYGIEPMVQHFGCMVDLLGRVGRLEEALEMICSMPLGPDAAIWSTFLRAYESHQNVELAELAFRRLVELDPSSDSAHVVLSKVYAKLGRWDDMRLVRRKLHELGTRKKLGCSMIEQDGSVHEFTSEDFSNPLSREIYSTLSEVEERSGGESGETNRHSERLAVAFGLITSERKTPIRVVNNLRICADCHSFMKFVSRSYEREIVIRDNYRFHRFKDGNCSCKEFW